MYNSMKDIDILLQTKNDIRDALTEEKYFTHDGVEYILPEVNIDGGMTEYADIIRNEYNTLNGYDMSWIYDEVESFRCNLLVWNELNIRV